MRVATIGTGGIARRHLTCLEREPEVEIVGHVTRTAQHAADAAARFGGRGFTDFRQMLDQTEPEAVWICVPPGTHGAIEEALIDRSIPFFVEKPLDANCTAAEAIARRLEASNAPIAGVAYHWRAMDTVQAVREALDRNPARMVIGAWHDSTPPVQWWWREETGGGQMVEQATHLFDIARHLVGEAEVAGAVGGRHERAAFPTMDVPSVSAALLRYGAGAIGVFSATCLLAGPASVRVQFACDGLLVTLTGGGVILDSGGERQEMPCRNDPFLDEDRAFLEAVRTGDASRLLCTYADALLTHRLCCGVREAMRSWG